MTRIAVFLDTNLCLHWQPFEHIPWHRLLPADFVRLVLCPPVTRELDVHKEHHRIAKIRERAQTTLARVWELRTKSSPAPIAEHLEFVAVTRDLRVDDVAGAEDLNLAVADDALVAHAIAYSCALKSPRSRSATDQMKATLPLPAPAMPLPSRRCLSCQNSLRRGNPEWEVAGASEVDHGADRACQQDA